MTGFEAFRYYMSLKLHFTSDYDALKYNFKTGAAKPRSYEGRKDRFFFEKTGSQFNDSEEIIKYYVANLIKGSTWIRDMNQQTYAQHTSMLDGFYYKFGQDLKVIDHSLRGFDSDVGKYPFDEALKPTQSDLASPIITLYQKGKVSLQTLACIDNHVMFVQDLRKTVVDPLGLYKETFDLIENYKPFFRRWVDHQKAKDALLKACTS